MLDIGAAHRAEYEIGEDQSAPVTIAEAPGRIHYLGEHGEPKMGLFFSSAIDRYARVAVSLRKDNSLRFFAADLGERKRTTLINLKYKREDRWANNIKVAIHLFADMGFRAKGMNFTVAGDIPQQVGLASSQAIEVAAVMALKGLFHAPVSEKELLTRLCAAQTDFFERNPAPVDYQVIFSGKKDRFLVVDEPALSVRKIKSPITKYRIILMDSRVPRMGVEDELRERRKDLKKGLELLSRKKAGTSLRSFAGDDLVEYMGNLPEKIRRRCMHVVQELRRVGEAADAMEKNDMAALPRVFFHSHESLRDLYEVSCPEVDWLVKRAQEMEGVLGSRMTGQGFGGCTYTIIGENALEEYRKRLEDYERIFGFHPLTHEIRPAPGARIVSQAEHPRREE
ncbi:MAG: galactokinase [Spirochaetaceae bacterium]|jgi:galactokinase|nr:galactokinase [Spirochaetaceae bacterium]